MEDPPIGREEYIQKVLSAYRQTPETAGVVRRADRLLASQWYARGVPLHAVENALVLAASRRLFRPAEAPPLGTIRSLAYFVPSSTRCSSSPSARIISDTSAAKIAGFYSHPSPRQQNADGTESTVPAAPRLRRGMMTSPHPLQNCHRTPSAWMIMTSLSHSKFCSKCRSQWWVTSTEQKWVTLAERRRTDTLFLER